MPCAGGGGIGRIARIALRDGHPVGGGLALDVEGGIRDVADLCDHAGKVDGCARDAVGLGVFVPVPDRARRRGEVQRGGRFRHGALAVDVAPAKRRRTHVADVFDAVGFLPGFAKGIEDLLPMRPGLHLPRGDRGSRAHVGTSPFDTLFRIGLREGIGEGGGVRAPCVEQFASGEVVEPLVLDLEESLFPAEGGFERREKTGDFVGGLQRDHRTNVEHIKMPDHIADGPRFELRWRGEARVVERFEQGGEGVRFGLVIGGLFHGVLFGAPCLASQATCRCAV